MKNKFEPHLLTKRIFSLLLTFVLIFGMVPAPAFALPAGVSIINTGNDLQTPLPTKLSNGQIWTDKSVKYLGSSNPSDPLNGQFEIKLRAAGQDYEIAQPPVTFDIILALDYSRSMSEEDDDINPTKLEKQVTAAKAIAAKLVGPPNNLTGNRVAIVKFSDVATLKQDFTDSIDTLNSMINEGYVTGYTNIQNAFYQSEYAFEHRTDKSRKPILILISDGAPTVFHNSLTSHTPYNDEFKANSGAEYVWWTIQQGMKTKLGEKEDENKPEDDVAIYTIGFDLTGNTIAEATLQPTAQNTEAYRPITYTGEQRTITSTGTWFRVKGKNGDNKEKLYTPIMIKDNKLEIKTYNSWTPYSGSTEPTNIVSKITFFGDVDEMRIDSEKIYYRQGNRNDIEYRNIVEVHAPFAQDYWEDSFILGDNYNDLYNALDTISQSFTSSKPLDYITNTSYTNLVIEDVIGSGYDVVGSPTGITRVDNTLTWTIDGDDFVTQAPDTATLDPTKVSEVVFKVKVKDGAAINTPLYTNSSAKSSFSVAASNPFYPDNALTQVQPITNKGWLTLSAPPVAATITVTKHVSGPVTAIDRNYTFTLYDSAENGNVVAGPISITVNGASSNTGNFSFNIPYNKFNENNQVTYYVQENDPGASPFWTNDITVRKAVTVTRTAPTGNVSFTNSYTPTGSIIVMKAWSGAGPQSNVTFDLFKLVGEDWTLVSSGHTIASGSVEGIRIGGLLLDTRYKVVETGIQDYLTEYSVPYVEFSTSALKEGQESLEKAILITNNYKTPIGEITLIKHWNDNENAAQDRPSQIQFNIEGPAGYTGPAQITLSSDGGWTNKLSTYTFGTYTFTEVVPLDYTPDSISKPVSISMNPVSGRNATLEFTNTYVEPMGMLTVKKTWTNESDDYAAFRPATITLKLLKDGVLTGDEVILPKADPNDPNPWEHTFTNLEFGNYTVEEITVPDYKAIYSSSVDLSKFDDEHGTTLRSGQIVVTNEFLSPKGKLTVSKLWVEDGVDATVVRPSSIDIKLLKNGNPVETVNLSSDNNWKHEFENLDLDNGLYTVSETSTDAEALSMYETGFLYSGTGATPESVAIGPNARCGSIVIKNTYAKGTITIGKTWVDNENPSDELPLGATVTLHKVKTIYPELPVYAAAETSNEPSNEQGDQLEVESNSEDGELLFTPEPIIEETIVGTQTIMRPENMPVVFYDLEIGENITYYVTENEIPFYESEVYQSSVILTEGQSNATIIVTNTYIEPKGLLTVTKEWEHGNNPNQPTSVTVELYEDGEYLTEATFSDTYTFEGLDLGKTYTIKELPMNNYKICCDGFEAYTPVKRNGEVASGRVTITNTYVPELGNLVVNKEWVGNIGGPIDVTVSRSYGNTLDSGFVATAELNESNDWTHTFEGFEVYGPGGVKYTYCVQESGSDLTLYSTDTSETTELCPDVTCDITITNTYAPEKGALTITKEWLGLNEDNPPSSIEVRLAVNGVAEESTMILNEENDWTVVRSGLNVEKTYSVKEVTTFEEFDVTYSSNSVGFDAQHLEKTITITNTRTPDAPSIDVNKSITSALIQLSGGTATFNYSVQMTNNGNRTLHMLSILDKMTGPQGATISYNLTPESNDSDGALFDLEGSLSPGQTKVFEYSVTVNRAGTYTNVATGSGYYVETQVSDTGEATGIATNPPTPPNPDPDPDPDPDPNPILGLVNVTFVDTQGVTLSPGYQMVGTVGTNYITAAREVVGYSLVQTPSNANGTFSNTTLSVVYVYGLVTEVIAEEIPLGDSIVEEPTAEEILIVEEDIPLADALPQTGQLPTELFYGIGGLISAAGVFLRRRKGE